jgi:large conductance mechanosensitive channel
MDEVPSQGKFQRLFLSFRKFIKRGNFFELAAALVVGKAFSDMVSSFVNDLFVPLTSLLLTARLSEVFVVLKSGPNAPYNTREQAVSDGALTLNYGNFIETIMNFFVVSFCFYVIVVAYQKLHSRFTSPSEETLIELLTDTEIPAGVDRE